MERPSPMLTVVLRPNETLETIKIGYISTTGMRHETDAWIHKRIHVGGPFDKIVSVDWLTGAHRFMYHPGLDRLISKIENRAKAR